MNDFKELDPACLIPSAGYWYVGVRPSMCQYLHKDLTLYNETLDPVTGEYNGLWGTEIEALEASLRYYRAHARLFPWNDRYNELSATADNTTNTSASGSQQMVFK